MTPQPPDVPSDTPRRPQLLGPGIVSADAEQNGIHLDDEDHRQGSHTPMSC